MPQFSRRRARLVAATARRCGDGQDEEGSGRLRGPRERGGHPLGQREGSALPSFLRSWSEAEFWAGPFWEPKDAGSGGQGGCGFGLGFSLLFFLPVTGSALFRETGPGALSLSPGPQASGSTWVLFIYLFVQMS